LTNLFKFRWSVVGDLSLSTFENVKGESRASKDSVCDRNNAGVATVIRRLNNIMIALMSISYKDIFAPFINFITEEDKASRFGGSQIAYKFDLALAKVSNSVLSVIPMKNGSEHGTRDPRADEAARFNEKSEGGFRRNSVASTIKDPGGLKGTAITKGGRLWSNIRTTEYHQAASTV
jgi:hypothetical protein